MRLRHPDGTLVHLAYCTNVHPADDLAGVLAQLGRYCEPVRDTLGAARLGIGLWLGVDVVRALDADPDAVRTLRRALTERGLEVVTLNAFPYTGFHRPVVKKAVYHPDWTETARLAYMLACARVLAALLPDDVDHGSVSSLPVAWRTPWTPERSARAHTQLHALAAGLADLQTRTGRTIRVGLEPEPGCVIETTTQAAAFLTDLDPRWIGLCLDTCHLAVAHEEPAAALARLAAAGVPIVKTQASCALQANDPADPRTRAALLRFAEPRFLHQVKEATGGCVLSTGDKVLSADDLPGALTGELPGNAPWRVHFHVPLHAEAAPPLRTTRPVLLATLDGLFGGPTAHTAHVEVETYTWSVLPDAHGPADVVAGVAAELAWARKALTALGLTEEPA